MPESHPDAMLFSVRDRTDVLAAVQRIREMGLLAGADEVSAALVSTIFSELASNMVKYAGRGFMRVAREELSEGVDLHMWAEDNGPGIPDIERAMRDHFSTGGTLGLGLPGVERMADDFEIQSVVGHGTRVHVRKRIAGREVRQRPQTAATPAMPWDLGMHVRPMPGEAVCGDATVATHVAGGLLLAIVDATGHGALAADAARRATDTVLRRASDDLPRLLSTLHSELTGTQGAAVGLLHVIPDRRLLRFAGVGNTAAARRHGQPWRGVSRDGVLGQRLPSTPVQEAALAPGDIVVLWTDGLHEPPPTRFAGLPAHRHPSAIARELVETLARPHDDAGCIVLRWMN
jgi:anti-sigma regulatory factor (Ser/Thr protein kinase)